MCKDIVEYGLYMSIPLRGNWKSLVSDTTPLCPKFIDASAFDGVEILDRKLAIRALSLAKEKKDYSPSNKKEEEVLYI